MNGRFLTRAAFGFSLIALGACTGDVAVQAEITAATGDSTIILTNLPIEALPYNRDAIFDSLATTYTDPEPAPPDTLVQLRDSIAALSEQYANQTARWGAARDSLQTILDVMNTMSRASGEYRLLNIDYQAQLEVANAAERAMNAAFDRRGELEARYQSMATEYNARVGQWADMAFAEVDSVIAMRLEQLGREEAYDTTDASGIARFSLKTGEWWIHARYDLPFDELYWNVPVTVVRGETATVLLNRETAEVRPRY